MSQCPRRRWLQLAPPVPTLPGLVVTIYLVFPQSVIAQCVKNQSLWFGPDTASIGLAGGTTTMKSYAIGKWQACGGMGPQFPVLLSSANGAVNIEIALKSG